MKLTVCLFAAFVIFSMKESSMTDILKENEIYYISIVIENTSSKRRWQLPI